MKKRKLWATAGSEELRRRFFQLIADHQYPCNTNLQNKNIILHCTQAGGLGDVSHIFHCAETIRKNRPDADIDVLIQPETVTKERISSLFPVDRFKTQFFDNSDYFGSTAKFEDLSKKGYPIGIAVGLTTSGNCHYRNPHFRMVREYGFAFHPNTKESTLSMGLGGDEEGMNFPSIQPRTLTDITSDWLKGALNIHSPDDMAGYLRERKLYHMYMHNWTTQIASLYSVATLENQNNQSLDVFIPLEYSLKQYIDWGILNLDFFQKHKIGKLVRVTPEGTEVIHLGPGKEMRILSGSIPKADMEAIQQHSQPFFGCTGDLSFSEAVVLNKSPIYDAESFKKHFLNTLKNTAKERGYEHFARFIDLLQRQTVSEDGIYESPAIKPKKQGGWYGSEVAFHLGGLLSEPNSSNSIYTAKCIKALAPQLCSFGEEIARCYTPQLLEEAQALNSYLPENCNFDFRLIDMVNRGMYLKNYPDLIQVENQLWEKFNAGQITEKQVIESLSAAIENCTESSRNSSASDSPIPDESIVTTSSDEEMADTSSGSYQVKGLRFQK